MILGTGSLAAAFTGLDTRDTAPVLGVVRYTTVAGGPELVDGVATLALPMTASPAEGFREVWYATRPPTSGRHRGLCYAYDGETLFVAGTVAPADRYRERVREAYRAVLELTDRFGCPHLLRMWNVIGDINGANADGLERYRDFCQGRAEALDGLAEGALCAATGIGAHAGGVGFYCLATARRPVHLENPRQVPAYRYPARYGPRAPSFARATYLPAPGDRPGGTLYVSGTASVLGHATAHPGDLAGQFATTLDNLRHLLTLVPGGATPTLECLRLVKVYVRHARDVAQVRAWCAEAFAGEVRYLTVDICRADLLLEIEAVAAV